MSRRSRALALVAGIVTSFGLVIPLAHAGPPARASGDIDGDGRADLVISRAHGISVLFTGGLGRRDLAVPEGYVSGVAEGDFNGDGSGDVAVGVSDARPDGDGQSYDGAVYVWYGGPSGLTGPTTLPGPANSAAGFGSMVEAADIDADHRADLLVLDDSGSPVVPRLTVLLGRPGGLSLARALHLGRQRAAAVAVGDLNGDGHPDLVVGRPETGAAVRNDDGDVDAQEGTLAVYYGRRHGLSTQAQVIHGLTTGVGYGALGTSLAIARINGDRYADIVTGAPTTSLDSAGRPVRAFFGAVTAAGTIAVLYGGRGGVTPTHRRVLSVASRGVPGTPRSSDDFGQNVTIGDLNGDGRPDVIAEMDQDLNGRNGAVFVFRGTAAGISTSRVQRIDPQFLGNPHHVNYEAMRYGAALVVYRPSHSAYASLAIGAPGYIRSAAQWLGLVDLIPGSRNGLTTHGARRIYGSVDKGEFGSYLAR